MGYLIEITLIPKVLSSMVRSRYLDLDVWILDIVVSILDTQGHVFDGQVYRPIPRCIDLGYHDHDLWR